MSRADAIRRLQTARGHVEAVVRMLEEERYCTDVLYQLHAVERALEQSKRAVLDEHFHVCVHDPGRGVGSDAFMDEVLDALYGGRPPRASRWYPTRTSVADRTGPAAPGDDRGHDDQ